MGTIFQSTPVKARILQGEKTSFPVHRKFESGKTEADYPQGNWVGLSVAGREMVALEISAANEVAQAKNALLVIGRTTNDASESGKVSCQQGFYLLQTKAYKADDSYAVGDRLTVRYVAGFGGGVLAADDTGTSTHFVAQVLVPPVDASANTPMTVMVFPVPTAE